MLLSNRNRREGNFLKVNGWIFLNIQRNTIFYLCTGKKLQIFCKKNHVCTSVMQNIGYFCKKNWRGWLTELKFCRHVDETFSWKKPKQVFCHLRPSLWKCNLKYLNICLQYWWTQISALAVFWKQDQLVPCHLDFVFTSCLLTAWIATDSMAIFTAAVGCVQLVPKYISKVNLSSCRSPNISVWKNWTGRKWGRWW